MSLAVLCKTLLLLLGLLRPWWAVGLERLTPAVEVASLSYRAGGRPVAARAYRLPGTDRRAGVVLSHGMAWAGMDDPRLVELAKLLAQAGFVVLTPDLEQLKRFRLDLVSADQIRAAVLALSARGDVDSGRIGLFGLSYAGSLGVIAAAGPELSGKLRFLASFGGYWSFEDLARYTLSGDYPPDPEMARIVPELYGRLAFYYNYPELLDAGIETEVIREICGWGLRHRYDQADALRASLSPAGRRLLWSFWGLQGDNACIGWDRFHGWRQQYPRAIESMGLEHWSDRVRVPEVFVLHSAGDAIVPAAESRRLAAALERRGSRVHLAVSELFRHLDTVRGPQPSGAGWRRLSQIVELYRFFAPLVEIAERTEVDRWGSTTG